MVGGTFGLALSSLAGFSITTGVHVQNLDHLGVALVLVVVSVVDVGASSLVRLAAPGRCGGSRGAAARCRPTLPSRAHVRIETGLIVSRQAVCAAIAPRLDDLDALLEALFAGNGGPLTDAERQAGWARA